MIYLAYNLPHLLAIVQVTKSNDTCNKLPGKTENPLAVLDDLMALFLSPAGYQQLLGQSDKLLRVARLVACNVLP